MLFCVFKRVKVYRVTRPSQAADKDISFKVALEGEHKLVFCFNSEPNYLLTQL